MRASHSLASHTCETGLVTYRIAENFRNLVENRRETFEDWSLVPPKYATPPNFAEKTFARIDLQICESFLP